MLLTCNAFIDKDKDAPNILCKSLKCGTAKEIPKKPWITLKKSEKMWADCSGIKGLTNLWQCATAKKGSACLNPATVICSGNTLTHWTTTWSHRIIYHKTKLNCQYILRENLCYPGSCLFLMYTTICKVLSSRYKSVLYL